MREVPRVTTVEQATPRSATWRTAGLVAAALTARCSVLLDFEKAPRPDAAADVAPRADVARPADVVSPPVDAAAPRPDVVCACDAGQVCVMGACASPCPRAGEVLCGDRCMNVRDDNHHCGGCDIACERPTPRCCNGTCAAMCM